MEQDKIRVSHSTQSKTFREGWTGALGLAYGRCHGGAWNGWPTGGPAVQHRELYPTFRDNLYGKRT